MSWVAIGVAAVSVGVSAGMAASASPPGSPDLSRSTAAGIDAEAAALPWQRQYEAAAQQGGQVVKQGYTQTTKPDADRAALQKQIDRLTKISQLPVDPKNPSTRQNAVAVNAAKTKLARLQAQYNAIPEGGGTVYVDAKGNVVPASQAVANFAGFGEADVQGAVARQNAASQLALSQKYDPAFIDEALKEQQLADPQGTAARKAEMDLIQQQIDAKPDRPVATLLDKQIGDQLAAGKNLDAVSDSVLRDAVGAAQADRGQANGNAEQFAEPLTTGFAGAARQQAGIQKAGSWLSSGATPEDVDYRREQQNLSNLGAFVNGATPESQFQNLSGAQQGAAPFTQGDRLTTGNPNAGTQMAAAQMQGWNTQMQSAENTANPWMAGLGATLRGVGAAGAAGWKPLAVTTATQ
ncbi:MAG TPA: hypothetical protein VHA37_04585 [Candidatus Saccharimonadales bacterium]|nr:hypothetical protein [Candidatus Saccharimonadales bacterium]